jgi:hypothetical protein
MLLEDHSHPQTRLTELGASETQEVHAIEDDGTRGGFHQPMDRSQKCAFAGARRANEANDLVALELQ